MIISRGRGYIFVHAPKTGGTALTLALEARAMAGDILIADTPKAKRRRRRLAALSPRGRLWKHSKLCDIEGVLTPEEIAAQFVITLVRNPWDRMVSYYHWLRAQSFDHPAVHLARARDFSGFLNAPETGAAWRADTAASYVTTSDGVERCRLFARLEQLDVDLAPFESHLGFRLTPLARINASERDRDYRKAYSDADAALLETLSSEDIRRFDYLF